MGDPVSMGPTSVISITTRLAGQALDVAPDGIVTSSAPEEQCQETYAAIMRPLRPTSLRDRQRTPPGLDLLPLKEKRRLALGELMFFGRCSDSTPQAAAVLTEARRRLSTAIVFAQYLPDEFDRPNFTARWGCEAQAGDGIRPHDDRQGRLVHR